MKQKLVIAMAIIAIVTLAMVTCKDDNETAHTHVWGEWQTIPPTCENDGYDIRICSTDNTHTETRNPTAALGHNYEWDTVTEATYDTDGEKRQVCTHDNSIGATEIIPKYKTEQPFIIGGGATIVTITLEYRRDDDISLAKVQYAQERFQTSFNEGNANHLSTCLDLLAAGGNYRIVVDYVDNASVTGFNPTDNQTLKVGKAWLETNPTINPNTLRNALNAMLVYTD